MMPWGALAGAAIGAIGNAVGGGGSGGSTTSSASQTTTPYLSNVVDTVGNSALDLFNSGNWPQYYPGSTYAPFTDAQNQALAEMIRQASGGEPITGAASNFATNLESGAYLDANPAMPGLEAFASGAYADPSSNPHFAATLNQLTSQAIPGVVSQFVTGGNLNNPAMAYAASQGATDAIAPYLSSLYTSGQQNQLGAAQDLGSLWNQGVQTQTQGLALAPSVQQMAYYDPSMLFSAGAQQQSNQQGQTNADVARWNYGQTEQQNMINWLASIGYGAPGGSATATSTTPYLTNSFANALGGANSGAQLGNSIASLIGAFG